MNSLVKQLCRACDKDLSLSLRYDPDTSMVRVVLKRRNVVTAFSIDAFELAGYDVDLIPLLLVSRYERFS